MILSPTVFFYWNRNKFLIHIISFCLKNIFLQGSSAGNKFAQFYLSDIIFPSLLKNDFTGYSLVLVHIYFFNTLKILYHSLFICMVSSEECAIILILFYSLGKVVFTDLKIFLLFKIFCNLNMIYQDGHFVFCIYPAWGSLWFGVCHLFWIVLSFYHYKGLFCFLPCSPSGIRLHICYTF